MFKNPVPEYLQLEPPKVVSFLFSRVFKRDYSTTVKVWTAAQTQSLPIVMGVGTTIVSLVAGDTALSMHNGETTYLQRLDDHTSRGWYTPDPKTRMQMGVLEDMGETPKKYFNQGTTSLNSVRVRRAYYQCKQAGFAKDFNPNLD